MADFASDSLEPLAKLRNTHPQITQRGLGRNQNKERSMTYFWHYMFGPTNKKPEANHEAFS